jgi:hypothetical protein
MGYLLEFAIVQKDMPGWGSFLLISFADHLPDCISAHVVS